MLYYEFKKLFGKRKRIVLLGMFSVLVCFFTIVMCRLTSYNYEIIPFEEYLAYYWLYGMSVLYIIIFLHVSVFPVEEINAMSQILLISKFGREQLAKTKVTLSLILTNIIVLMFLASSLLGYSVAFALDFKIPIIEYYETIYTANSIVNTSGGLLFMNMTAFIITANFTALFSMYMSAKIKNTYLVCILLFLACFLTLFSLNPEAGIFFSLTPFGNYIVIGDALKVMFLLGSFSVTPYFLSLAITFMLICILYGKIKNVYRVRK